MRLVARAFDLQRFTFIRAPVLPRVRPFGPAPPPRNWSLVRAKAELACEASRTQPVGQVERLISNAYAEFVNTLEAEVGDCADTPVKRGGARAGQVIGKWQKVLVA